ncbi:hypothetical protein AMATHDRAFT_85393 [Amanita thiersii Skay4041]|uniref:Uncharacterized protein n=1 Tax=Amanita thiersii Skay4041 TaxID=703135 RepID=A0A2A9NKC0_9AGAR|nr:hypothetical protein AMATHDRAFT_85393 [Amanita thiersii Skay4041]
MPSCLKPMLKAMQAIQEQQCTILAALTPLLPLLQTIPLHIDSVKNCLTNSLRKHPSTAYAKATQTSPIPQISTKSSQSKRPRTISLSENLESLGVQINKKPRLDRQPTIPLNRSSTSFLNKTISKQIVSSVEEPSTHNRPTSLAAIYTQTPHKSNASKVTERSSRTPKTSELTLHESPYGYLRRPSLQPHKPTPVNQNSNVSVVGSSVSRVQVHGSMQLRNQSSGISSTGKPKIKPSVSPVSKIPLSESSINTSVPHPLTHQLTAAEAFERVTMRTITPQAKRNQISNVQLRAATHIPSRSNQRTQRKHSPPVMPSSKKGGRRFIPLLDSDDDSIASP